MTNEDLCAAIEAALRRRDPVATVRVTEGLRDDLAMSDVRVVGVRMRAVAPASLDALRALALACGLRPDGSDPAEEVERFRAAFRREEDRADERAQSFDDLVVRVWRAATGDTHEGPASVDALVEAVKELRATADEARADAARAREAYAIDLAGLRDALRRADDDRAKWRERVAELVAELDATRAVFREDLHCDECIELATRCHAETASFGCDAHGVGEGWADTTHAAAVRAAVAR